MANRRMPQTHVESSADEDGAMSPLQKIAREMETLDQLESEIRDKVMPLSPVSSRTSSVSSTKSSQGAQRQQKYLYDRPPSSRASTDTGYGYEGTEFSSGGPSVRQGHDSMSIRSGSTRASRMSNIRPRTSALRKEILRSPDEAKETAMMDLFAFTKERLRDLPFKTPNYGNVARTPELLLREMLKVVFGWNEDITALVRDEMKRHRPGSASGVMLAKWLGDMGADSMANMIGSESMTSSDWMLLALSSIGQDSQRKVGEAFVQRLLEKGDIHPAVAILLGLGEQNDAIEVYVSQGYLMEAIILTCLSFPSDWDRQSFLLHKWGQVAVQEGLGCPHFFVCDCRDFRALVFSAGSRCSLRRPTSKTRGLTRSKFGHQPSLDTALRSRIEQAHGQKCITQADHFVWCEGCAAGYTRRRPYSSCRNHNTNRRVRSLTPRRRIHALEGWPAYSSRALRGKNRNTRRICQGKANAIQNRYCSSQARCC
jgi:hypothetical protein